MRAPGSDSSRIGGPLVIAGAGAVLVVFAAACLTAADPDLWGHVRFGLDLWSSGHLVSVDPYSFTQDRPWINHEWLAEWQMALAWTRAGGAGLAVLKGLLVLATAAILWRALSGVDVASRLLMLALAVIGTVHVTSSLRPQVWSLLLLALVCRVVAEPTGRWRWLLVPVFGVWANLHGGWIIGLIVAGGWALGDVVVRPATRLTWALVLAASAGATLLNPYGPGLWEFLASTVRVGRPLIEEWQPLYVLPWPKWLPWIALTILVGAAVRRGFVHRGQALVPLAALAFGSLQVTRVLPFYSVAVVVLLAPWLRVSWPVRPGRPVASVREQMVAAVVILVATSAAATWVGRQALSCVTVDDRMPESAPVRLLSSAPPGRLVTFFDWGEYALWHLGPDIRVSMDGRRETVYSDARLREHDAILFDEPAGLVALDAWRAEYAWLPAASRMSRAWFVSHGYRIDFESSRSFVAVRADLPPLVGPLPTDGVRRCFPD